MWGSGRRPWQRSWRQRWRERPQVAARGFAVGGSPGFVDDPEMLDLILGDPARLEEWSRDFGVTLDDSPSTVGRLDEALDGVAARERRRPGTVAPRTSTWGTDIGLILGTVLVRNLPDARWFVPPDGHPVVRLGSGRYVDVVDAGRRRVATGLPRLVDVYEEARNPRLPSTG